MGRVSSIKRLPAEVRDLIRDLRSDGRTIEEILAKLRELDVAVSQSALGRWTKKLDALAGPLQQMHFIGEAIDKRVGDQSDDRVNRANVQMARALMTRLMLGEDGEELIRLDPKEAMYLTTALHRLSAAEKLDAERVIVIRRETAKDAARAAKGAAKKAGLSKEAIEQIERDVLGIAK